MLIRPIQADDIGVLANLMVATPLWQRYGVTVASATARLHQGFTQNATIAVAETQSATGQPQLGGFIWYVTHGAFQRGGYVLLIGVQPTLRSQGIGAALMHHAEQAMYAEVASIFLLVSDFNAAAQRFYQRLGYQRVGAIPDFVLPGVSELIFYKRSDESVTRKL